MVEPVNLTFYNKVMDRTAIKQLISRLINHFGITYTTHILDQLKTLGFQQATLEAISLGIDDLLTAPSKNWLLQDAERYGNISEKHHHFGNLHAVEKLRQLIETWYATSEYLKQEMNPNFRITDPLNPVYMMSFSGARGSTSQVHQLVGMRGLMSDPHGQIIDLPIQSNFREGLSLTEYIISCYGARKGVVDTAVRTSDAGYLTRRLVEVVQHLVVRKIDCETLYGISLKNCQKEKKINFKQKIIGRVLSDNIYINNRCFATRNQDVGNLLANKLFHYKTKNITIRSPLTCKSIFWICQLCYGWSLTHGSLIEIGEAVGIIAGQSIGEPGTQLTLRTFHTGGVFTGDIAEHVRAPFNGIIEFNTKLVTPTRTRHGHPAWICHTHLFFLIKSNKKIHHLTIPPKSLLLIQNNQYVESKQIIAEIRAKILPFKEKIKKYIYSNLEGEMHWSINVFHASKFIKSNIHFIFKTSHIWVLGGNFYKKTKIPVIFYKNQDKIDLKIIIAKEELFLNQFFENKNKLNKNIFNLFLKKNKLKCLSNNFYRDYQLKKSNIVLLTYEIKKKNDHFFLFEQNLNKSSCPFLLQIKKNGILQHNDVFAISENPNFEIKSSGFLKYGTIKVDLIEKKNDVFFNRKKNHFFPKYKIIKEGNFFFIPEEIYESSSVFFVKNNSFIKKGTLINSKNYSQTNGLVRIKKKLNNIYELKILPGIIYYPQKTYEINKQTNNLLPPGEKLFNDFYSKDWKYIQWIIPSKEKPFLLIRPTIEYKISKQFQKFSFFNLKEKNNIFEIKAVQYLFYEDGEQIKINNKKNNQLVQTCLILHWKEPKLLEKAQVSFMQLKIKKKLKVFFQISLVKYSVFSINNKKKKLCLSHEHRLISQNKGFIRSLQKNQKKQNSFLILSSCYLIKILKNNEIKNYIEKNCRFFFNTDFFDFTKKSQQFNSIYKKNQKKNLLNSVVINFSEKLGLLGFFKNIINFNEIFYLVPYNQLVQNKYSIINNYQNTLKNPKWFLIDETKKIYQLIFEKNIYRNLLNWCFPVFFFYKKFYFFHIGQFLFENIKIVKNTNISKPGQIISIFDNYLIIRLSKPYLATKGAIVHNNYGEFLKEGDTLITLIYERLKSGDIIQGLPKVEQLLEARPINSVYINLENGFEDWNKDMTKFLGNSWGFFLSTKISIKQSQINLVEQIQKVYQSQSVYISNKHVEIIVRQITSKVLTLENGMNIVFLPGELIEISKAKRMNRVLNEIITYKPILLGITKASLNTQSFISEASFQETTRVLARAALKGRIDWLKGLKENVIIGTLIPAGTGSQEVVWQITLEKQKEIALKKNSNLFYKKIQNFFLYKNSLCFCPTKTFLHQILKTTSSNFDINKNNSLSIDKNI